MRKIVLLALIFLLALCCGTVALANSAASYWEGLPGQEMLAVDESCPIEVSSEQLTFDLRDMDAQGRGGSVQAVYQMHNPTDEQLRVEMAFPFISSIAGYDARGGLHDIDIRVDGQPIEYQVYYSVPVEQGDTPDIKDILPQRATGFDLGLSSGVLYTFRVSPQQKMRFAIDLSVNDDHWVLNQGFNSWHNEEDGSLRLAATCSPERTERRENISLFIIGEPPPFTVSGWLTGEQRETPTDAFSYEVEQTELSLRDYLLMYNSWEDAANEQMTEARLDRLLQELLPALEEQRFLDPDYIGYLGSRQRAVVLNYAVDFPAGGSREVSVSYAATAAADSRSTKLWQYRLDYLLNPARFWADFADLSIIVLAPQHSPYIAAGSIEMSQTEPGVWQAELAALPEDDLSFTLFAEAEITRQHLWEKKVSDFFRSAGYMLFFGGWLAIPVLALVVYLIIRRKRKARHITATDEGVHDETDS